MCTKANEAIGRPAQRAGPVASAQLESNVSATVGMAIGTAAIA